MAMPASPMSSPSRTAEDVTRSSERSRRNRSAMARVASQTTVIVAPMNAKSSASNPLSSLKWLRTPRAACPTMITISRAAPTVMIQPARHIPRPGSRESIHARAAPKNAIERENLRGLNQSGAPSSSRWSTTASTAVTSARAAIATVNP
jgi:hypothetical protein